MIAAVHSTRSLVAVISLLFSFSLPHGTAPEPKALPLPKAVALKAGHLKKRKKARQIHRLAGPYAPLVQKEARKHGVPVALAAAVVYVENGGNFHDSAHRVSSAGAIGVMQLMPDTAWKFLRVNPWSARQNIQGGVRYLAYLLHEFHGNPRLAIMAYNAGPTAVLSGYRPASAVHYANQVLRLAEKV